MVKVSTVRSAGLALTALLFVLSLAFNTFLPAQGDPSFLLGIICLLFGFVYAAWYANPLLLLSAVLLLLNRTRWALLTSALAVGLASSALLIDRVPYNEGGMDAEVVGYGPGFLLWLGSMSAVFLTSLWCSFASRRDAPRQGSAAKEAPGT